MTKELVKDWMTTEVVTTSPSTPLSLAYNSMKKENIRRLIVMDEDNLVGILSLRDAHETKPTELEGLSIWNLHRMLSNLYVKGSMTPDPVTVSPKDTIGHAANLMLQNKISGLPVVDENQKVVGIITETDIFRAVIKMWGE